MQIGLFYKCKWYYHCPIYCLHKYKEKKCKMVFASCKEDKSVYGFKKVTNTLASLFSLQYWFLKFVFIQIIDFLFITFKIL